MPEEIEVPTEELHEKMEEAAEEGGAGRKWISRVALSSAMLAVLAAISALLAGGHANEAILEESEASSIWAQYQAKGIKSDMAQLTIDLARKDGTPLAPEIASKPQRYSEEQKEIKKDGDRLKASSAEHMQHHERIAISVTIFQIAIAIGAISVLARRPKIWLGSLALGIAGLGFFIYGVV